LKHVRAVVQCVSQATVVVDGEVCGTIDHGLLVYLGVSAADDAADVSYLAEKIARLRVFPDDQGRMNRDVIEAGGSVLVVSNFTLCGDARKGRRPSYVEAAPPEQANELYERFCATLRAFGLTVETGRFRAMMDVQSINVGPVNVLLDSKRVF